MTARANRVLIRNTSPEDFAQIIEMSRKVYPTSPPWREEQLASHLAIFPEGQLVAVETEPGRVVGMAASLIIRWEDYSIHGTWREFTDGGMFTNHDPEQGRTLYGAEVMVRPSGQGGGIGSKLYAARRALAESLALRRIRAAARLRGYQAHAHEMSAESYVLCVVRREIKDPTLSFQLKHGFAVIGVVPGYLHHDPESLGFAALIEWINRKVAKPSDYADRDPRFQFRRSGRGGHRSG